MIAEVSSFHSSQIKEKTNLPMNTHVFAYELQSAKPFDHLLVQHPITLNQHMNMKTIKLLAAALLLSAGAYAQSTNPVGSVDQPGLHKGHGNMDPAQRAAMKAERKAKFDKMTPAEREAFRTAHRAQREAKLNALPAEKREKIVERQRMRKTQRKQVKVK
jgi:protein CpxP